MVLIKRNPLARIKELYSNLVQVFILVQAREKFLPVQISKTPICFTEF